MLIAERIRDDEGSSTGRAIRLGLPAKRKHDATDRDGES